MADSTTIALGKFVTEVMYQEHLNISHVSGKRQSLLVFDQHTHALFGQEQKVVVCLQPGEQHKTWSSIHIILQKAIEVNLERSDCMIAVGGGVVCDITAFCASVYMRGCNLILVPTTLLSMVDAAIGGKTGINFADFKNMAGTFYPAEKVCICIGYLQTLPSREFITGLAEVIKTAMLGDRELFRILKHEASAVKSRDRDLMRDIVRRCISVKSRIVTADFTEQGNRAILNLGHTFGHALEAVTGFRSWTHGEAVAWGLAKAMDLGVHMGITSTAYREEVKELLIRYGFLLEIESLKPDELLEAMKKDKKRMKGRLRFILQRDLCNTDVVPLDTEVVRAVL